MGPLDLIINGKKYVYIDNISINNVSYIAFTNGKNVFINRYVNDSGITKFFDIDDYEYKLVKGAMRL